MAWAAFILSFITTIVAAYFVIKGRKVDRPMMVMNFMAALMAFAAYFVFLYDQCCYDIVEDRFYRAHFLRPMTFFILSVLLANILRYGKRNDDDKS